MDETARPRTTAEHAVRKGSVTEVVILRLLSELVLKLDPENFDALQVRSALGD